MTEDRTFTLTTELAGTVVTGQAKSIDLSCYEDPKLLITYWSLTLVMGSDEGVRVLAELAAQARKHPDSGEPGTKVTLSQEDGSGLSWRILLQRMGIEVVDHGDLELTLSGIDFDGQSLNGAARPESDSQEGLDEDQTEPEDVAAEPPASGETEGGGPVSH